MQLPRRTLGAGMGAWDPLCGASRGRPLQLTAAKDLASGPTPLWAPYANAQALPAARWGRRAGTAHPSLRTFALPTAAGRPLLDAASCQVAKGAARRCSGDGGGGGGGIWWGGMIPIRLRPFPVHTAAVSCSCGKYDGRGAG
jgi:hypothetical protein